MSHDGGDNLVEIRDLSFSRREKVILDGVDIDVRRGSITAIMGPNGTGKTTLLRLIGGQLIPDRGAIVVDGVDVHTLDRKGLYNLRKRMGMLFQGGGLFTDLTVFENVAFPLREHTRLPERLLRSLVLMKLEAVGMRGARDLMPAQLSGGMQQRIALGRSIVLDPMMMMYDEPFAWQDPISMGATLRLVRLLNDTLGLTSIIVSHDVHETAEIADYIYVLFDGKVREQGTPEELESSKSPRAKQFLEGLPDGPVPFHYPGPPLEEDLLGEAP